MAFMAVANPVTRRPKRKRSLRKSKVVKKKKHNKRKRKNPAALVTVANPSKTRSMHMARRKKTKGGRRRRKNRALKDAVKKGSAVSRRRRNPRHRKNSHRRRHRNPGTGGNAWLQLGKLAGGALVGYVITGVAGNALSKLAGNFLGAGEAPPDSVVSKAQPFIKPAVEAGVTIVSHLFGSKVIPDKDFALGITVGSAVKTGVDTIRAVVPQAAEWLDDAMGDVTPIDESSLRGALEYAMQDSPRSLNGVELNGIELNGVTGFSGITLSGDDDDVQYGE